MCLLLAAAGRWGYHRDEPYYVLGGRHPDWGYVDHPPVTPLLARWSDAIFSPSLTGFRLLPALVSSSLLIVAAFTASELGGSDEAAAAAAVAALACPLFLGSGHWFQTVVFDQLLGSLAMLVWLHLLGGGASPWWLVLGLIVGIGLQNKWTMAVVVAAVGIGTLASDELRSDLVGPWLWLGILVAAAVWAPNLLWQRRHGWPTLEFIRGNRSLLGREGGWAAFFWQQLGILGVPLLVLAAAGLLWAWGESAYRPAVIGVGLVILALAVVGSKPYYHGPFLPFVFAAGAVAIDGWIESSRTVLLVSIAVWAALSLLIVLPLLPPGVAANFGILSANDELAEELGWPDMVDQVKAVFDRLPGDEQADARILTRSYGEAAVIELLGPRQGLPSGITLSGHNSAIAWWPDDQPQGTIISVRFDRPSLLPYFEECENVDHVKNQLGIKNQIAGAPIMVCRGLKEAPTALRDAVRLIR